MERGGLGLRIPDYADILSQLRIPKSILVVLLSTLEKKVGQVVLSPVVGKALSLFLLN